MKRGLVLLSKATYNSYLNHIFVFLLYAILTLVMTYPLAFHLKGHIPGVDLGDPLFETWTISWDIHKILTSPVGFWDANIFFPHKKTLAYSDHLIIEAAMALPLYILTKDSIFSYNIVFLLSFPLAGFGAYLLVYSISHSFYGALLSGVFYAFCPFRFYHIGHLQLIFSQWFPFILYYLHKLLRDISSRSIILSVLFIVFQSLSSMYYGAFTIFIGALFFIVYFLRKIVSLDKKYITTTFLIIILYSAMMIPFLSPYFYLRSTGLKRTTEDVKYYSAGAESYFLPPPENKFWPQFVKLSSIPEGHLFPGVIIVVLSVIGFKKYWSISPSRRSDDKIVSFFKGSIFMLVGSIVFIIFTGGYSFMHLGFHITLHRLKNPLLLLGIVTSMYFIASGNARRKLLSLMTFLPKDIFFYLLVVALSIIFSFYYPYLILYKTIPGFDGIRVPSRFAILANLGLSVLAGFGAREIVSHIRGKGRSIVSIIILLGLLFECYSSPIPIQQVDELPQVYRRISQSRDDSAIIELPMGGMNEYKYVYYSTFHWKKLVNGISGYIPSTFFEISYLMKNFPSSRPIKALRKYGVRYIIIHKDLLDKDQYHSLERNPQQINRGVYLLRVDRKTLLYELSN